MVSEPKVSSSSPGLRNLLKIVGIPIVSKYEPSLSSGCTCDLSLPESHVRGGVTVYVNFTSFSISSDFWDIWLVQDT